MMGVKPAERIEELPLDDRKRELFKARMTRQGEGVSQDGFSQETTPVTQQNKPGGSTAAMNIHKRERSAESSELTSSPDTGVPATTYTRERKRKSTPEKNRNAGPSQRWNSLNNLNDSNAENNAPRMNQVQPNTDQAGGKLVTPPTSTRQNTAVHDQPNTHTSCTKKQENKGAKGLLSYFQPAQTSNSETPQAGADKPSSSTRNISTNSGTHTGMGTGEGRYAGQGTGNNSRGGNSRGSTSTYALNRNNSGTSNPSTTTTTTTNTSTNITNNNNGDITGHGMSNQNQARHIINLVDGCHGPVTGFSAAAPPPKRPRTAGGGKPASSVEQTDVKITQAKSPTQVLERKGTGIEPQKRNGTGVGADERRWNEDRDELHAHEMNSRAVAEVTQQLSEATKDLERQKRENAKLIRNGLDLTMKNSALVEQVEVLDERNVRARTAIHRLLVEEYRRRRTDLKTKTDQNNLKLVAIAHKRKGTEIVETWQDGFAFQAIQQRNMEIQARKRELESVKKARKAMLSKKKGGTKGANGKSPDSAENSVDGPFDEFEDPILQEEILNLQRQQITKEEKELMVELHAIEHDRALHLRELKRQRDEAKSIYNDFRTINGRYLLLELLGKGGFSEVYKAYDFVEMTFVACKLHVLNSQWSDEKQANYLKHAWREYQIHKDLRHPYIVSLLDVFELEQLNSFCTVLEYCEGSDLDFYLKHNRQMSEREARCVITQLFSALNYLNQIDPPVIHFDLKPANILYQNNEIKVTDFGLSKVMKECDLVNGDEMELTSQGAGTYWYLPPETFLLNNSVTISSKVDVWSAGIIFYQLLYGKRPFGDEMSQNSLRQTGTILNAREVTFPPRPVVSDDTKEFISLCLTYNKEARPDVLTMCRFPYLASGKR